MNGIVSRLPVSGVVVVAEEFATTVQFVPLSTAVTPVHDPDPAVTGGAPSRLVGHTKVLPPVPFWQTSIVASCPVTPPVIVLEVALPVSTIAKFE